MHNKVSFVYLNIGLISYFLAKEPGDLLSRGHLCSRKQGCPGCREGASHLEILLKGRLWLLSSGQSPKFSYSNKLPGDAG